MLSIYTPSIISYIYSSGCYSKSCFKSCFPFYVLATMSHVCFFYSRTISEGFYIFFCEFCYRLAIVWFIYVLTIVNTLYSVHYTMYSIHYTVYTIHYIVYNIPRIQYTLYTHESLKHIYSWNTYHSYRNVLIKRRITILGIL